MGSRVRLNRLACAFLDLDGRRAQPNLILLLASRRQRYAAPICSRRKPGVSSRIVMMTTFPRPDYRVEAATHHAMICGTRVVRALPRSAGVLLLPPCRLGDRALGAFRPERSHKGWAR